MTLLGRSHHGSSEAEDTPTLISHGVEISIAGGGADEKDGRKKGAFFFFFTFFFFTFFLFISYIRC